MRTHYFTYKSEISMRLPLTESMFNVISQYMEYAYIATLNG